MRFSRQRKDLIVARRKRQQKIDQSERADFVADKALHGGIQLEDPGNTSGIVRSSDRDDQIGGAKNDDQYAEC